MAPLEGPNPATGELTRETPETNDVRRRIRSAKRFMVTGLLLPTISALLITVGLHAESLAICGVAIAVVVFLLFLDGTCAMALLLPSPGYEQHRRQITRRTANCPECGYALSSTAQGRHAGRTATVKERPRTLANASCARGRFLTGAVLTTLRCTVRGLQELKYPECGTRFDESDILRID